ncbi:MAG: TolC family protein [Desulfobacterales bacterium]|nr:TolC family protein [Desulfobacterales bacterium]
MMQLAKKMISGLIILAGFASVSWAETAGENTGRAILARLETRLSLPDLLTYAYDTSPSITASKQSWKTFIENYRIGTSYPDPTLATTYYPSPIETRLGPQDWNFTLSQVIPFPGTLSRRGKVLESDVAISRLRLDKTVKILVRDLSTAYYELVYIQNAIAIARANLALNEKLVRIGENSYAQDRSQLYDLSKASAQTAQIHYDIHLLEELEKTEKARINTLINREPDAPLGPAGALEARAPVYTLEAVYELAMAHQEDIRIADLAFDRSTDAVRLAELENLPSFKLGLFYAGIGNPDVANPPADAGDDAVGLQLGLNLPLWFGKNKSRKAKALALKEKSRAEKKIVSNRIKEEISRLWFKMENSRRLVTLYETRMLPRALDQVATARTWFEQGLGNFSDFLEVRATAYNFQLSLERARADYGQTLVKLEQLAGVVLDRKKTPENDTGENGKGETL